MKLKILRLGINGEGVSKGENEEFLDKVCFVPFSLPNEVVDVDIVQNKKSYCLCKVNNIIESSDNRINPPCKYFGKCGGCDIQHMDKPLQQCFKRDKIRDAIIKISGEHVDVYETVGCNDFAYRNKMVYPIVNIEKRLKIGMFSASSHSIVDIDNCLLAKDVINRIYIVSKKYFESSDFIGYDFTKKKGDLKYLVVRVHANKALVTIVATKKVDLNKYYNILKENFENNIGISLIISDSQNEIMSGKYTWLAGLKNLEIEEFGIKYQVDNRGFMQVNDEIKAKLYEQVLEEIRDRDHVIDCYSGAGLMSAIVSKKCKSVVGIEINESASKSAKALAKDNNLGNVYFLTGDVKKCIDNVLEESKDVIILDPPRSGCERVVLEKIISNKIKKIIYISCDPATLARDIGILKYKYDIKKVIPWDMFPQTKHVETLCVLEHK